MIVKANYKPNFGDITTGDTYETQVKRNYGDIFECDDALAKERIKKGFVVKTTKEEQEEYKRQQKELNKAKEQPVVDDSNENSDKKDNDVIKTLEEYTVEELIQIGIDENIELVYPKDDTAKDVIIQTINTVRTERLEQSNNV